MGAESTLPPKQRKHKRSLAELGEPMVKRGPGNATTEPTNTATFSVMARRPAAKRVSRRQLDDGPIDAIASSSAPDGPASAAGATPATSAATAHVCGHCQKRFRSPGKLAQHEREAVRLLNMPQAI